MFESESLNCSITKLSFSTVSRTNRLQYVDFNRSGLIWFEHPSNDIKIDTNASMYYEIFITVSTAHGTPYQLPLTVNVTSVDFQH